MKIRIVVTTEEYQKAVCEFRQAARCPASVQNPEDDFSDRENAELKFPRSLRFVQKPFRLFGIGQGTAFVPAKPFVAVTGNPAVNRLMHPAGQMP